jgi:anthranilate synthase component 1
MHGEPPVQALALQRRLPSAPDPLALFAALTDGGRRGDTMLLERNVGPTLLMDRAALRIEARGQAVVLHALSAGGHELIDHVRKRFPDRMAAEESGLLRLRFPGVAGDDAEARLLAESPLDVLRCLAGLACASREEPFTVALLGVSAFDQVDLFENLPANRDDPLAFPDFVYWLAESLIVFEPGARPRLVCTAFGGSREAYHDAASRLAALYDRCADLSPLPEPAGPAPFEGVEVDLDDEAYGAVVTALKEHIAAGDIYQVVPSRTFRLPCADPLLAFHAVRRLDPSPYRFFVSAPGYRLFGASPETSVRVFLQAGWKTLEVKPIAGTRPRGATPDEDDRFEAELRLDGKELAEHMMLVDLARNDVARISLPGTRRVAKLMTVERYARVMHLVSSVTGTMRIGYDALHALQACLNVGTLTGAPKIRATELLRRFEKTKRGPYGGAIGWLNGDGLMDTGVVIRSAVVKDGVAFVRAGAGVVFDSDPRREADETLRKASALLSILAGAGAGR